MKKITEAAAVVKEVLEKERKLTGEDLQRLRENTVGAATMSGRADYFVFRMDIELIDAIRSLNETSTRLVTKTNNLTLAILGLTFAAVILAAIQVWIAVRR